MLVAEFTMSVYLLKRATGTAVPPRVKLTVFGDFVPSAYDEASFTTSRKDSGIECAADFM